MEDNYRSIFRGCNLPSCLDCSDFFLDDNLPFTEHDISGKEGHVTKKLDLLTPKINSSRVLSYSMFIEPIERLKSCLAYDQILELSFLAAAKCTPVWFYEVLMRLGDAHLDEENQFKFGLHPFFDVIRETYDTYGDWQTAYLNRFSPSGGEVNLPEVFGAAPNSTEEDRERGKDLLTRIIAHLFEYTVWIDNSLVGKGNNPSRDMPLSMIIQKQQHFVDRIKEVVPCQFGLFGMGVFTTVIAGAGVLKPGQHLRQLAVPAEGCASFKHLMNTDGDAKPFRYSPTEGTIHELRVMQEILGIAAEDHDRAMLMIAARLNIPYHRDLIETLLVSSFLLRLMTKLCHALTIFQTLSVKQCMVEYRLMSVIGLSVLGGCSILTRMGTPDTRNMAASINGCSWT